MLCFSRSPEYGSMGTTSIAHQRLTGDIAGSLHVSSSKRGAHPRLQFENLRTSHYRSGRFFTRDSATLHALIPYSASATGL
ncbi:hypothetical protein LIA77_07372 [Sarocladium implicatum]|nr:hypothetical protein LIA77_07372 [Sarocladium implicatum]